MKIIVGDLTIQYKDDDDIKQKVFDRVIKYFVDHQSFHGEVIHQNDDCIIDAPSVLSDIADNIIHFEVESNES